MSSMKALPFAVVAQRCKPGESTNRVDPNGNVIRASVVREGTQNGDLETYAGPVSSGVPMRQRFLGHAFLFVEDQPRPRGACLERSNTYRVCACRID